MPDPGHRGECAHRRHGACGAHGGHGARGAHGGRGPGDADFEALYASGTQWSGNPNEALVRAVADLAPGTAVDVGCGEGADAAFLAARGWQVVGVDPAATAVERSARAAAAAGVAERTEFIVGDIASVKTRQFDLVSCFYLPLAPDDTSTVPKLEKLVAPGGTLVFVHHDFDEPKVLDPREAARQLGHLDVVAVETSRRHVASGAGAHHTVDVVLVARRPG